MKRTFVAAGVLTALVFGTVGYAYGADQSVTVTAGVTSAFSMTINQSAVALSVTPGTTPSDTDATTAIQVKSNKLWDFSKSVSEDATIASYLSDTTSVATGTGLSRGVTDITCTYTLDTSTDGQDGWTVPAGSYSNSYTYSAVQQ